VSGPQSPRSRESSNLTHVVVRYKYGSLRFLMVAIRGGREQSS